MRKSFISSLKDPNQSENGELPRSATGGGFGIPTFKGKQTKQTFFFLILFNALLPLN